MIFTLQVILSYLIKASCAFFHVIQCCATFYLCAQEDQSGHNLQLHTRVDEGGVSRTLTNNIFSVETYFEWYMINCAVIKLYQAHSCILNIGSAK